MSAIETARILAAVYGHEVDQNLFYPQGVALSGRLRLAALEGTTEQTSADVARLVADVVDAGTAAFDARFGLAGWTFAVWADELATAIRDQRHRAFLLDVAAVFDLRAVAIAAPLDSDVRVEDFFFAGALLGRAFAVSGNEAYADALARYLVAVDTQQADGLFWHCHASPYYWGRGNAFAALGFAEALTYLPSAHPSYAELVDRHRAHLQALAGFQDTSGMWRQLIDDDSTYLEHSGSTMITCALARGVRLGWLDSAAWWPVIERAWRGIEERTSAAGELAQVCIGTGPLDSRDAYVDRAFSVGRDDRGGAMALWCAVEVAKLQAAVGAKTPP